MRHVLSLDSAERRADVLLVNRLFGKLTAKEFKAKGAFTQYQHQKTQLLDYISAALADSQIAREPAPESHRRSAKRGQWSAYHPGLVDRKYLRHYQWLGWRFGEGSEQQESFGRLIRQAYSGYQDSRSKPKGARPV